MFGKVSLENFLLKNVPLGGALGRRTPRKGIWPRQSKEDYA